MEYSGKVFARIRGLALIGIGLSAISVILLALFYSDIFEKASFFQPIIVLLFAALLLLFLLLIWQAQKKISSKNSELTYTINQMGADVKNKIKELEALYEDREKIKSRFDKSEKSRRKTVEMVSHEIKTDLTPIRGYTHLLLNGKFGALSKKQVDALKSISDVIDHQTDLLNKMILLSKLEGGESTLNFGKIDYPKILRSAVLNQRPLAKEKGIKLSVSIQKKLPQITGGREELKELIINLLNNAIKYTSSKGKILVKVEKVQDKIVTSIKDTGKGIPKKDFNKIFTKFYRGVIESNEGIEGSGLGLSICKSIICSHKGKIWFESEQGLGTSFFFSLPIN